jgi:cobalt/nickel transport system permease protein
MHHSFIDKYSDRSSAVHNLSAIPKILVSLVVLVCILATPIHAAYLLIIYAILIAAIWFLSGVPILHLLKRLSITIPFIALIALGALFANGMVSPVHRYLLIVAKAVMAIAVLTILTSTTQFPKLMEGFSRLGTPKIISSIMAFLYRYIFILIDEAERLNMGRKSRQLSSSKKLAWKGRAWMMGTLFVRSLERSERVYRAMLSRGFAGEIKVMHRPKREKNR